jgi:hypothetical protein
LSCTSVLFGADNMVTIETPSHVLTIRAAWLAAI